MIIENKQLKEENKELRYKLQQTHELMINEKNLLDAFLEKMAEIVEKIIGR